MIGELKRAGMRLTPQRLAIVKTFAHDGSHPTAQDLYERLLPDFPSMSFATVYKTLDVLAKTGLCGNIRIANAQRFDPNTAPHHHLVCESCGKVFDVPTASMAPGPAAVKKISRVAPGFSIRSVERVRRWASSACRSSVES